MSGPWSVAVACACLGVGVTSLACRAGATRAARIDELRAIHGRLHEELEDLIAHDPLLQQVQTDGGDIIVAIRSSLLGEVIREVARRYLDRVELELTPEATVTDRGEIKTKTFLGTVRAGEWRVKLTIHRVRGVLRTRPPRLSVPRRNRVSLALPVVLEKAEGFATVHFAWDASVLATVVCRDFELTEQLHGHVLPDEYQVEGAFLFSAASDALVARPEFPQAKFHIRVDLSPESWTRVRDAIASQDTLLRCGIAIDPEEILPRLQKLGDDGFDVALPRALFRSVVLPATVRQSVRVDGRDVVLTVRPSAFRVTAENTWYSVGVRTQVQVPPQRGGHHHGGGR